jgi:hypothetical protein
MLHLENNERKTTMNKVLLTLLAVVLVLGALGAAGYAGYQYGFNQGVLAASDGDTQFFMPRHGFGFNRMPMDEFGFNRGFDRYGFGMMDRGFGFGFFSPLLFLARIAFWVLVIWAVYLLIAHSGWRLTRTTQTTDPQPKSVDTEVKE